MAPPSYNDLGKSARDVFSKGYNFNLVKLECRTKTAGGMHFNVSGSSNAEDGRVKASLESKYKVPEYGFTLKEKWTTDNILTSEISVEEKPVKGIKFALDTMFVPQSGKKSAVLSHAYKNEYLHYNTEVDLDLKGPLVKCGSVLSLKGWLAGAQFAFDTGKNVLTKSNVAVGYATDDFTLHTNVNDGKEFGGSVYQKVNDKLETGVQLAWSSANNVTSFGLGCVYSLDKDTSLRAKINNLSEIGMGISHRLREGIHLTISAMVDGKNFNQGGHKLGIGLELEA